MRELQCSSKDLKQNNKGRMERTNRQLNMQDNNKIEVKGQEIYTNAISLIISIWQEEYHEKSFGYNKGLADYASKIGDLDVAERCYKRAIADAKYLGHVKDNMDCLYLYDNKCLFCMG